jgi:undecaprenyl-diphosphatase
VIRLLRRLLRCLRRPASAPAPVAGGAAAAPAAPVREAIPGAMEPWPAVRWRTRLASLAAAVGAAIFGLLGWLVGGGGLAEPDLAVSVGVQQAQPPLLLAAMALVSLFGSPPLNVILVLAAMVFLWLAGHRVASLFSGLAAVGIGLATGALKAIWLRPRPEDDLVRVFGSAPGYSFPSGHTLFYTGFFGFLLYWSYTFLRKSRLRTVLLWLFGLLIVLVGPSRVYLGHHWTSDVLAAYALGLAYLFVLIRAYSAARLNTSRA